MNTQNPDNAVRDYLRGLGLFAVLALFALVGVANPASWSPMGQAQQAEKAQHADPSVNLSDFDIPDGWGPGNGVVVVPADPSVRGA